LQQLIDQAVELRLQSEEIGKFGRVLGRLFAIDADGNANDLNQQMIDDGHALPYDGGKRSDADFLTPEFLRGRQPA